MTESHRDRRRPRLQGNARRSDCAIIISYGSIAVRLSIMMDLVHAHHHHEYHHRFLHALLRHSCHHLTSTSQLSFVILYYP